MALLLDTHAFLWWCEDSRQLSGKARNAISEEDCFVSLASFWEISIKMSLNKLRLPQKPERYLADQMSLNGFDQLNISFRQIMRLASLPFHHRDPFDRMLAAQAQEEELAIVSRDPVFAAYGLKRIW